jgi:hypothetical protein
VGWLLARMLDVDIPLEIAQYAEGKRIVASFVLDQVTDADKKVPQYLVLLSENKDGMPFDYNQFVSSPGTSSGIVMRPPIANAISMVWCAPGNGRRGRLRERR